MTEQDPKHYKGYFIFDGEDTHMEFYELNFSPAHGVISGESTCGYSVSGTVQKRGRFHFQLTDPDFNQRHCWGKISNNCHKIQGQWGWEEGEKEDDFAFTLQTEDDGYGDEECSEEYDSEEAIEPIIANQSVMEGSGLTKSATRKMGRPPVCSQMRAELGSKFKKLQTFAKQGNEANPILDAALEQVQQIIDAGQPWTDNEFPPCQESIQIPGEMPNASRVYEWKRAKDILGPDFVVFNEDIDPNDINQGELGNCYFLAVLSACSEDPRRIRDRVKVTLTNDAGIYCVTMYINGVETPVIIDDWFPTCFGKPAFCKTKENELWAMLFEKAWAKVHGSFMRTEGGQTAHACQHMIGLPAFTMDHNDHVADPQAFFNQIEKFDVDQFVMLASSTAGTNDEFVDGIVQGHAYALLSAHRVTANGQEHQILKLRNPWGKGEWDGDWSDNSHLWTDQLRSDLQIQQEDDGIFCIGVENYLTHFSQSSVCVTIAEHLAVSETSWSKDSTAYFSFTLKDQMQRLAVTVCQQGDRLRQYRPKDREDVYKPSPFSIILIDEMDQIVGSSREKTMSNFFHSLCVEKVRLRSGKYTLIVDVDWQDNIQYGAGFDTVNLAMFTAELVEFTRLDAAQGEELLAKALFEKSKEAKYKELRNYYRESDVEYGDKLYRINDNSLNVGFYSSIVRKNDSPYSSNEKLAVELNGQHWVGEYDEEFHEIPSGGHSIYVMRSNDAFGSTGYGMSMAWKARDMSDSEMVVKCREKEAQQLTADVSYRMMLSTQGGVMVFENSDSQYAKKIGISIEGSQNLRIQDGDSFLEKSITVQPSNKGSVIMKLLSPDASPQLSCSFTCKNVSGQVAEEVQDQWTEYVANCWATFDADGSGELDQEEARRFCQQLFTGQSAADFDRVFSLMDADESGTISQTEMAQFMREHCS